MNLAPFAATAALVLSFPALACKGLDVDDPWIREAPPGAMMTAAYARFINRTDKPITLDGASSSAFDSVELHHTVVEGGLFKMKPDAGLTIPAGERAALEPGGWHLMLMEPKAPLKAGDRVPVRLQCGHETKQVLFTVRAVVE